MLWINDNITSLNVIRHLFLPSLISLIVPLVIMTFRLQGETQPQQATNTNTTLAISRGEQMTILSIGIASLLFVPVFKEFTNLPPFMGIMLALGACGHIQKFSIEKETFPQKRYTVFHPYLQKLITAPSYSSWESLWLSLPYK